MRRIDQSEAIEAAGDPAIPVVLLREMTDTGEVESVRLYKWCPLRQRTPSLSRQSLIGRVVSIGPRSRSSYFPFVDPPELSESHADHVPAEFLIRTYPGVFESDATTVTVT